MSDNEYEQMNLYDEEFDIEPAEPRLPCIHILNDDVMFNIFSYMDYKELVSLDRVCKRWRHLIRAAVLQIYERHGKNFMRMLKWEYPWYHQERNICLKLLKLLRIIGPRVTAVEVDTNDCLWRTNSTMIIFIISRYCLNAESIYIDGIFITEDEVKTLFANLKRKNAVHFYSGFGFDCIPLMLNNAEFPLVELVLYQIKRNVNYIFEHLPQSLKKLTIFECSEFPLLNLRHIPSRCHNLESLIIDAKIPSSVVENISVNCPRFKEIGFVYDTDCADIPTLAFNNVVVFHIFGVIDNEESFNSYFDVFLNVNSLYMSKSTVKSNAVLNFSRFRKLKRMSLPCFEESSPAILAESFNCLLECSELETLCTGSAFPKDFFFFNDLIARCPQLREIILLRTGMLLSATAQLVKASAWEKRRKEGPQIKVTYAAHTEESVFVRGCPARLRHAGYLTEARRNSYRKMENRNIYDIMNELN